MPNYETRVLRDPSQQMAITRFMNRTYGWMFVGLTVTALVAYLVASSEQATLLLVQNPALRWTLPLAELGVVMGLSMGINRISAATATLGFLFFAALNGATFSLILQAYTMESIGQTFMITAGMFGGLALFGTVTRRDLSAMGAFFAMGLWGLILVGLVNMFVQSSSLSMGMSVIGVVVFAGLTAWDAQKIKALAYANSDSYGSDIAQKQSVFGALMLYLDFINIFLFLIRLTGNRRRD